MVDAYTNAFQQYVLQHPQQQLPTSASNQFPTHSHHITSSASQVSQVI